MKMIIESSGMSSLWRSGICRYSLKSIKFKRELNTSLADMELHFITETKGLNNPQKSRPFLCRNPETNI